MQIDHIPLGQLAVSKANMRAKGKSPDIADILPSVIARGVLSPLFVRPAGGTQGEAPRFEIVAGKRRYHASLAAAKQRGEAETPPPLPCIVLGEGDDAEALEVSMIENLLRQDPDQVTQWESFSRLVKEGRSVAEIAAMFALEELQVKRVLALGDLLPRIREAFRAEEIDPATVRQLTLASKAQQKAWLALYDDPDAYAPRGHQLKAWLFGGASISTNVALFDLAGFAGTVVADLFEDHGWFAEADAFWAAQMAEVEARKARYLDAGWSNVVVIAPDQQFASWDYEKAGKRKGGRVYIQCRANGEVVFHEGYVTRREAQQRQRGGASAEGGEHGEGIDDGAGEVRPARPELTAALASYVDLHRHAVVRAKLAEQPGVALRVMLAHAICGSPLWSVKIEDQRARHEAVTESVAEAPAAARFAERRRAVLASLGFDAEREAVTDTGWQRTPIVPVFLALTALPDTTVMEAMAVVMAETLAAGSDLIEVLGAALGVDLADHWQADAAMFDLIRDRAVLTAMLGEIGGAAVAEAHADAKGQVLKSLIGDYLDGLGGRAKVERWVPRWMAFPPGAYTARGGVPSVVAAERAYAAAERGFGEADEEDEPVGSAEPGEDAVGTDGSGVDLGNPDREKGAAEVDTGTDAETPVGETGAGEPADDAAPAGDTATTATDSGDPAGGGAVPLAA